MVMRKALLAMLALGLCPGLCGALEIKNVRPRYGPYGALRGDLKVIPGDIVFLSYDLEGLGVDAKTGKVSYSTNLVLLDGANKQLFSKDTPNDLIMQLGGTRVPGDLYISTGPKQPPGKYTIKLTVHDKVGKDAKAIIYPFEIIPEAFGFVGVTAPALGLPGQNYVANFALVNMSLDTKKQPSVEVKMTVFEGQSAVARPVFISLPKDLPQDIDVQKENIVPLTYPVYLNRPGQFTIEIAATDNVAKKEAKVRYTLTVLDLGAIGK
jgi:hypothetical protein